MRKKIFVPVLLFFVLLFAGCLSVDAVKPCDVVMGSHAAVTPASRPEVAWWMPRHQAVLDRVAQGNVDLLMIGDSLIHVWDKAGKAAWDQYYASRNAVNLGFGGDRTEHVLWRLQNGEIENINPKLAVLMIGTNNSGSDEQIVDGIKAIVCQLRTKLPETKVLILAIFPRADDKQRRDKEPVATFNAYWERNDRISQIASQLADGKMIFFLDVNKVVVNERGELTREMMPDLLHPGANGCSLWAAAMEPTIAKLMGETK